MHLHLLVLRRVVAVRVGKGPDDGEVALAEACRRGRRGGDRSITRIRRRRCGRQGGGALSNYVRQRGCVGHRRERVTHVHLLTLRGAVAVRVGEGPHDSEVSLAEARRRGRRPGDQSITRICRRRCGRQHDGALSHHVRQGYCIRHRRQRVMHVHLLILRRAVTVRIGEPPNDCEVALAERGRRAGRGRNLSVARVGGGWRGGPCRRALRDNVWQRCNIRHRCCGVRYRHRCLASGGRAVAIGHRQCHRCLAQGIRTGGHLRHRNRIAAIRVRRAVVNGGIGRAIRPGRDRHVLALGYRR